MCTHVYVAVGIRIILLLRSRVGPSRVSHNNRVFVGIVIITIVVVIIIIMVIITRAINIIYYYYYRNNIIHPSAAAEAI